MKQKILYGVAILIVAAAGYFGYEQERNAPPAQLSPLASIVYNYNADQVFFEDGNTSFSEPSKGVVVHEDTPAQATEIADELQAVVPASEPMSIPLALLASESVLDPLCVNGNFKGSNPTKSALGYDDGIAQEKLKYLIGERGVTDAASAQAFAFDVKRAIPYFWSLYQAHLATADDWISAGGPSTIDPRLMNRYILAAIIYKQGPTGANEIFATGTWPAELNNFVSLESYFAAKLHQKSVFAGLQ